jgi:glyoxylase-like metal-dependent hydrolase (beta-lactamase superfamily II)
VTFSDELTFHWNDETIRAFHVEDAHTDGDSIVRFENANVVHMGDTFFHGRYPFIDVDSGGTIDGVIAAGYAVLSFANSDTKIIPGHGPLADVDDLQANLEMLKTARDRVQALIDQGMSEAEVVEAAPMSEFDADFVWQFISAERFLRTVYRSLL